MVRAYFVEDPKSVPLELTTSLWGKTYTVVVDRILAHFAGLAYGDGCAETCEARVVTSDPQFADKLTGVVQQIAKENGGTTRRSVRPSAISDSPPRNIILNSTLVGRALFDDATQPDYCDEEGQQSNRDSVGGEEGMAGFGGWPPMAPAKVQVCQDACIDVWNEPST